MYFVYVFYDKERNVFYVGFTKNLKRRKYEHNSGCNVTTSKMRNKILVYYEACLSKEDAIRREKQLKTVFGRGYLKRRLSNYLNELPG